MNEIRLQQLDLLHAMLSRHMISWIKHGEWAFFWTRINCTRLEVLVPAYWCMSYWIWTHRNQEEAMKKHPGIWFSIWTVISMFLLGIMTAVTHWPEYIERGLMFAWGSLSFFWITVFHERWIRAIDEREYWRNKSDEFHTDTI